MGDQPPTQDGELTPEQLDDLFAFDPFEPEGDEKPDPKPGEEPPKPEPTPAPAPAPTPAPAPAPKSGDEEEPTPKPAPSPTPAPTPTPTPPDPMEELRKEMKRIGDENAALRRDLTTLRAAPPAPKEPPKEPEEQKRIFGLTIRPELHALLEHEDPNQRRAGLESLINSFGDVVYRKAMQDVQKLIGDVRKEVPAVVESTTDARELERKVHNDFYSNYPGYNNPDLYPTIIRIASRVAAEKNAQTWNPELRDAVAAECAKIFGYDGKPPKAPDPNPNPAPPDPVRAGGPRRVPQGTRPTPTPVDPDSQEAHMQDMFD